MNKLLWCLFFLICTENYSVTSLTDELLLLRTQRDAFLGSSDDVTTLPYFELQKSFINSTNAAINQQYSTDNRKPAFRGCKDYAPRLKEEQPANTFVIKVEADDPDASDLITYSFEKSLTERAKFRINSKTGEIVTSYTFDRDEPIREKEV